MVRMDEQTGGVRGSGNLRGDVTERPVEQHILSFQGSCR